MNFRVISTLIICSLLLISCNNKDPLYSSPPPLNNPGGNWTMLASNFSNNLFKKPLLLNNDVYFTNNLTSICKVNIGMENTAHNCSSIINVFQILSNIVADSNNNLYFLGVSKSTGFNFYTLKASSVPLSTANNNTEITATIATNFAVNSTTNITQNSYTPTSIALVMAKNEDSTSKALIVPTLYLSENNMTDLCHVQIDPTDTTPGFFDRTLNCISNFFDAPRPKSDSSNDLMVVTNFAVDDVDQYVYYYYSVVDDLDPKNPYTNFFRRDIQGNSKDVALSVTSDTAFNGEVIPGMFGAINNLTVNNNTIYYSSTLPVGSIMKAINGMGIANVIFAIDLNKLFPKGVLNPDYLLTNYTISNPNPFIIFEPSFTQNKLDNKGVSPYCGLPYNINGLDADKNGKIAVLETIGYIKCAHFDSNYPFYKPNYNPLSSNPNVDDIFDPLNNTTDNVYITNF